MTNSTFVSLTRSPKNKLENVHVCVFMPEEIVWSDKQCSQSVTVTLLPSFWRQVYSSDLLSCKPSSGSQQGATLNCLPAIRRVRLRKPFHRIIASVVFSPRTTFLQRMKNCCRSIALNAVPCHATSHILYVTFWGIGSFPLNVDTSAILVLLTSNLHL